MVFKCTPISVSIKELHACLVIALPFEIGLCSKKKKEARLKGGKLEYKTPNMKLP